MSDIEERMKQQQYDLDESQRIANIGSYRLNLENGNANASGILKKIFGFKPDHDLNIQDWHDSIHPDHKQMMLDYFDEVVAENKVFEKEYKIIRASDSDERWVYERAELKTDKKGNPVNMVGIVQDITKRKQAEAELYESKELFKKTFESLDEAVIILNVNNRTIVECNPGTEKLFGYTREELIGESTRILHVDEERYRKFGTLGRAEFEENGFFQTEFVMKRKNGEIFRTEHTITMVYDEEGNIEKVVSVVRDITEKKKAEEQNIRSIIEGAELERKRIAKELHDSLGQYLTAASMYLEHVEEFLFELPIDQKRQFRKGLDQLNKAINETRSISQNLLPKVIDDFGIALAVESLIDDIREDRSEEIHYQHNLDDCQLPEAIELNMYRIIQESLNNAIRHSECTRIDIQLVLEENSLHYTIEDNGKGFDPQKVIGEGLGLWNIGNRVNGLSGDLEISSKPDKGTLISIYVPI